MSVDPAFNPDSFVGPLPSPCISICVMDDASGLCVGCQRNLDEIATWGMADQSTKRKIWRAILARRESR